MEKINRILNMCLYLSLSVIIIRANVVLAATSISDTDGDTKVQTEETFNENRIRFDTAGIERMIIDNSDNIMIHSELAGTSQLLLRKWSSTNPYDRMNLGFTKARGTMSTPSVVAAGDHVFSIEASAYDGSLYDYVGGIYMKVNAITGGVVESDLHFDTANQSAQTGRTVMTINKDGNVGIGTTSPAARLDNNGDFITKGPWVDVRAYASFSNAIDAIGTSQKTLLIPNTQGVTLNKTVPSNITLWFLKGGSLDISLGVTVTINGAIEAGLYQIFSGSGKSLVVFGPSSLLEVYPQWWGAIGNGTDDTQSFKDALTVLSNSYGPGGGGVARAGGTLKIPRGEYVISSSIIVPKNVKIEGVMGFQGQLEDVGKGSIINEGPSASPVFVVKNAVEIRGITFENYNGTGIHIRVNDPDLGDDQAGGIGIFNCNFEGGQTALDITGFGEVVFEKNSVNNISGTSITLGGGVTGLRFDNIRIRDNYFNIASQPTPTPATKVIAMAGTNNLADNIIIDGNWFTNLRQNNSVEIDLPGCKAVTISNNVFTGNNNTGSITIYATDGETWNIFGNYFTVVSAPIKLVNTKNSFIGVNSFDIGISGNWIDLDTNSIQNMVYLPSGGTYSIANKPRNWIFSTDTTNYFNVSKHIVGSTTWDPPSLANGAATQIAVSVPGASLGDIAYASLTSIGTNMFMISANVAAQDWVRVVIENKTGGTFNLGSGTLRIAVWKETY